MYVRDVLGFLDTAMTATAWRVYSAEHSLKGGAVMESLDDVQSYVDKVRSSAWWRHHCSDIGDYRYEWGFEGIRAIAWARGDGQRTSDGFTLGFTPDRTVEMIVLHEMAHTVQPKWDLNPPGSTFAIQARQEPHDATFSASMVALVGEFGPDGRVGELADAYRHFDVPVMKFGDLMDQRATDREREEIAELERQEIAKLQEGIDRSRPTNYSAPTISWGDWLRLCRRQSINPATGRHWSMKALAEHLRPLGRVRAAEISALEKVADLPTDDRALCIGLGMVATFGLDPVWARTGMGLERAKCSIDFDELRQLNAEWVANVEQLNQLAAERPARWTIDGDR